MQIKITSTEQITDALYTISALSQAIETLAGHELKHPEQDFQIEKLARISGEISNSIIDFLEVKEIQDGGG